MSTPVAPTTVGRVAVPVQRGPGATASGQRGGRSPVGSRLARELLLVVGLYAAYSASRLVVSGPADVAIERGQQLLAWERSLGLDVELRLVLWLVDSSALSVAAGYAYASLHYTVTPAVLVWLYRRHPARYARGRSVLAAATLVAVVGYWLYPTAPPRLLPAGGFPDVLALSSQWGWWGADASAPRGLGGLTNEFAAMPSMHVGWAVWCGVVVAVCARRPWVRVLGLTYPLVTVVVVVATANHYLVDAFAGAAVVLAAGALVALVSGLRGPAPPSGADGRTGLTTV